MRVAFVGASNLTIGTARLLLEHDHEVIIVDQNKAILDTLVDTLGCGLVHGDGSKPAILRQVDPKHTDFLFCLTDNDQDNIIASLVGRSLGFRHVVTRIEDEEYEHICIELGLENTIIPDRTIARRLSDLVAGRDIFALSNIVKGDVRFFSFVAGSDEAMAAGELPLPRRARAIYLYRDDRHVLIDPDTDIKPGDEVVIVVHNDDLAELEKRWSDVERAGRTIG